MSYLVSFSFHDVSYPRKFMYRFYLLRDCICIFFFDAVMTYDQMHMDPNYIPFQCIFVCIGVIYRFSEREVIIC